MLVFCYGVHVLFSCFVSVLLFVFVLVFCSSASVCAFCACILCLCFVLVLLFVLFCDCILCLCFVSSVSVSFSAYIPIWAYIFFRLLSTLSLCIMLVFLLSLKINQPGPWSLDLVLLRKPPPCSPSRCQTRTSSMWPTRTLHSQVSTSLARNRSLTSINTSSTFCLKIQ